MIRIYLLRHGKTEGNLTGKYIGRTDEPLCAVGIEELKERQAPLAERIVISPKERCRQTADIFYPQQEKKIVPDLRECDFGIFENKNYRELSGNADYQNWLDSDGMLPFPEGEGREAFQIRCTAAWSEVIENCLKEGISSLAAIVHGGTIMAIMDAFSDPHEEYYHWQVKNGCGYFAEISEKRWIKGEHRLCNYRYLHLS